MISISHWGTFDVENYGDLMFPLILEKELTRRLGALSITLASPFGGTFHPQPWRTIERIARLGDSDFIEQSLPFDAFVLGGGDIVRFDGQFLAEIYDSPADPLEAQGLGAVFLNELGALARIFPVFWNAAGIPHDFTAEQFPAVRDAVDHVRYLSVRDTASKRRLEQAGVNRDVWVAPDSAVLVRELFPREQLDAAIDSLRAARLFPTDGKALCFHVSFISESTETAIAETLRQILHLHARLNIVLLPIGACHGDADVLGRLRRRVPSERVFLPDIPLAVDDISAVIARSDFLVSSSLHGNIAACVNGIDSVVLSIPPYSPSKLSEYAQWLQRPLVTDLQELLPELQRLVAGGAKMESSIVALMERQVADHFDRLAEGILACRRVNLSAGNPNAGQGWPDDERHRRIYSSLSGWLASATEDIASLRGNLAEAQSRNDSLARQSAVANKNIAELSARISEQDHMLRVLQARADGEAAELQRIKSTRAWRWASRYGRFKHDYLLPLWRAFGLGRQL